MPYIKKEQREALAKSIDNLEKAMRDIMNKEGSVSSRAGLINYTICKLITKLYPRDTGRYSDWNEVIGALECAKTEIYRRIIVEYESKKSNENGDVF